MSAALREHLESVPPGYFWHRHRYRLALAAVPPRARAVLDYGCGEGGFARALSASSRRLSVWAWDEGDWARRALAPELESGRVSWLDHHAAAFDFVSALDVLEHADDAALARRLRSLLRPGGTLCVTVPADPALWSAWDERLGHRRRYDEASLRSVLEGAGLRVERCTAIFSYLVPAAKRRARAAGDGVEFPRVGRAANAALRALGALERAWLRRADLKGGTSLLAVARRPS
ncbi:MAG: methyltransferase domain-containing protein [Elusimicrobia bacterium]|nr:methyltransferase domain-containing protein [Elusimicrobiota bacterium]